MAKARVIKATNKCGKRVKLARVEKDMTQLDLATALNVDFGIEISSTGISYLEKGDRFVKDFEIIALAEVLDKHPMWLLFGDKAPNNYKS
ncbi:MAG: helix-turn-helix domain-containing protein [Rickettsiales bacterium]